MGQSLFLPAILLLFSEPTVICTSCFCLRFLPSYCHTLVPSFLSVLQSVLLSFLPSFFLSPIYPIPVFQSLGHVISFLHDPIVRSVILLCPFWGYRPSPYQQGRRGKTPSFKFLLTHISEDLFWTSSTIAVVSQAPQTLFRKHQLSAAGGVRRVCLIKSRCWELNNKKQKPQTVHQQLLQQ